MALAGREGETPRMVFARAAELARGGKADEGLALLEAKAKGATTQPVQWKIAICQYRESIKDPAAAAQWIELGDSNVSDLAVQTAILKMAGSARSDRAFIGRTIDRLKDLTGPDALTWRIERARWLIASDDKEKDSADAVNTLNEVVRASPSLTEPHLLLSLAYENVGNLPAAAKELQTAADSQPNSPAIALDAARLLQLQSRFADARVYIERAGSIFSDSFLRASQVRVCCCSTAILLSADCGVTTFGDTTRNSSVCSRRLSLVPNR